MDPRHGEISRAMRNRGIEIYIPGEVSEILACFSRFQSLMCDCKSITLWSPFHLDYIFLVEYLVADFVVYCVT